jgi:hypothetical protein
MEWDLDPAFRAFMERLGVDLVPASVDRNAWLPTSPPVLMYRHGMDSSEQCKLAMETARRIYQRVA